MKCGGGGGGHAAGEAASCAEEGAAVASTWRDELVVEEVGGAGMSSSVAVECGCVGLWAGPVAVEVRGGKSCPEEDGSVGSGGGRKGGGGMRSVTEAAEGRPAVTG